MRRFTFGGRKTMSSETANTQKTIIVTGGSQGIGAGLVKAFLGRGYKVVANSRNITGVGRVREIRPARIGRRKYRRSRNGCQDRRRRDEQIWLCRRARQQRRH